MDWKHACQVILKNVSKKELPDTIFKCFAIKFYESFKHFETLNEQNRPGQHYQKYLARIPALSATILHTKDPN